METQDKINAYCIPGLGMNGLLFKNLRLPGFNVVPIEWKAPLKKETLPEYALRLAAEIDQSTPFILIGVSKGGMCAIEIAKKTHPLKTILISSCKVHTEKPKILRALSVIPLHYLLYDSKYLKYAALSLIKKRLGVTKAIKKDFWAAIGGQPRGYHAKAVNMLVNWKNETIPANVMHIHGDADRVIPYQKEVHYNYTIAGGSHLMVLDKAKEISTIIHKELSGYLTERELRAGW
jgi:hypothetical protein